MHTQYSFSIAPEQNHCLPSFNSKQVPRKQPSTLGSSDGTGHSRIAEPRVRDFPGVVEGGVGCVPIRQLSMWHCSLPPVLHQGKDARVPAQLKEMFIPLSQSPSHIFSTHNWHLVSTTSTVCRAMKQSLSVKSGVMSLFGRKDIDFGPDLSFLFPQRWV